MSLDVNAMVREDRMYSPECISCGACVDVCPKKVISFSWGKH
jgi:ferredoxin